MTEEVELPDELSKLEITPSLPQVKILDTNLPVHLNPFFENDIKDAVHNVESQHTTESKNLTNKIQSIILRPTSNCRRCRYRRASESILDELKYDTAASDSLECSRTPPSGILKQSLKKTAMSSAGGPGNRKVFLREPVLKAFQTCLHPQGNSRKNLLESADLNVVSAGNNNSPLTTKGMSDFRKLIDECRNLLSEEVDFTGKLNQLSLSSRNSKNFTTMQTPKIPTGNSNKLRSNKKQILNTTSRTKLSLSSISLQENQHNYHLNSMSLIQPSLLSHSISSTSSLQQRNVNNLSTEHPRCSTTCSQQAGNSAAAASTSDDVTIDELASYFDTFVHIPKKMSSMAEMMYI